MTPLTLSMLRVACDEDATEGAIVLDAVLEPVGGHGTPVNPAIYAGGRYQHDRRWESSDAPEPTPVIVIDNVPSQANRLEAALEATADEVGVPRLVLDLTGEDFAHLPPHLPRNLSSLRWPHRNADAYLRDALVDDEAFVKSSVGRSIIDATADSSGALVAWFPQALLYGFWQSHLGSKRTQAKHARAWVSEIVGWGPATDELVTTAAMKGDPFNIIKEVGLAEHDRNDLIAGWELQEGKSPTEDKKMSAIGHGQVITKRQDETLAPVSFQRITQKATLSFPQLRRVRLGDGYSDEQDAAARTLIAALGLHAHESAFGRAFALRSGTDLVVKEGGSRLDSTEVGINDSAHLVQEALESARAVGVPTEGWGAEPIHLTPNSDLTKAINATWPDLDRAEV
ncbi:MAG: type I-U CRISPR-associated protein Cas7 [Acidimicrobiia bacterium]|nr:type I-U CRISPR-associated protein Cas7 [Acidimicrobiia bacterium]MYG73387.1 type I-U CRISPR-associated protein Cas7 [Acidimicrobiia bacterium]MYL08686.1 type I-U CRISPR-associated protein Cas7 [Acidimicrobiia bacterium]